MAPQPCPYESIFKFNTSRCCLDLHQIAHTHKYQSPKHVWCFSSRSTNYSLHKHKYWKNFILQCLSESEKKSPGFATKCYGFFLGHVLSLQTNKRKWTHNVLGAVMMTPSLTIHVFRLRKLTNVTFISLCLLSQFTPNPLPWAHPWDPTIWMCRTDQIGGPTLASRPPSPLRRTQRQAAAQTWPAYPVVRRPPTPTTSAGATQATAVHPGGPSNTPVADRSQSTACTLMTSPQSMGRNGRKYRSRPRITAWNRTVNPRFPQRCHGLSLTWICQNQT